MKLAYVGGALLFLAFVAIGIYYLMPGVYHVLVFDDPTGQHVKHALLSFGLALLSLIGARFVANSRSANGSRTLAK